METGIKIKKQNNFHKQKKIHMKKFIEMLLDFPGFVNQKVFNGFVNTELDGFDSQNGIRHYVKTIYQWLAVLMLIVMEVSLIKAAIKYFTESTDGGLAKVGSVIAILVLMYAAFPIAKLIKSKGDALGESHNGMVSFVFNDFVKTNIRLIGEVVAIVGLAAAFNLTLSFVLDNNLYTSASGNLMLDTLAPIYTFPMEALNAVLKITGLHFIGDFINNATSYRMTASSANSFGGDFRWDINDLVVVFGAYINVLLGLVFMYINLAIYGFLYSLIETLVKWVAAPSLPISISQKNK